MAFKPKEKSPEESQEFVDDAELIDEGAEALERALSRVKAQLGETADVDNKVFVFLQIPDSNELARVWQGDVDSYDLDNIAKKFGSGKYMTKMYATNAQGRMSIAYQKTMVVRLEPGMDAAIQAKMTGSAQTPQAGYNPADLANVIVSAIKAAMPAPTAPVDPMQQLQGLAGIVATMTGNRPEPQQVDPFSMMRNTIEMMRLMKEDRDPIEGGKNADTMDVWMKMIDKFGGPIAEVLAAKNAQTPEQPHYLPAPVEGINSPPRVQMHAPGDTTGGQPANPRIRDATEEEDMNLRLRMGLSFLCMQAKADNDPGTYAVMAIENVPIEALTAIVQQDNYLDVLAKTLPEVSQYKTWFDELKAAIIEELAEIAKENAALETPDTPPAAA